MLLITRKMYNKSFNLGLYIMHFPFRLSTKIVDVIFER